MKRILCFAGALLGMCLNAADFSAEVKPDTVCRVMFTSEETPSWQLRFSDAEGNLPFGGILASEGARYRGAEKGTFLQEFYVPRFAAKVTLRTKHPVKAVRFESVPATKYRNINPEFKLGNDNYSGYARTTQSVIRRGEKGNYLEISDSRYGMTLVDPIPVVSGKTYRVSLRREGPGDPKKNIGVYIRFLDKEGRVLENQRDYWKRSFTFYGNWKNDFPASKPFTAPEGAAFLECQITNGKIAAFYVTEDGK